MPERSLLGTISDLDRARPAPGFFHGRDALFSFADKALSAATQEKNMPFQPGVSGNPAGRPRGSRNKSSILLESVVEKDLEAIMQTVTTQAKEGNVAAARLCLSALGRRHGQPVTCDLPPLNTPADVLDAMKIIVADVAAGELTSAEGTDLAKLVELCMQAYANLHFEKRLREVECRRMIEPPAEPPAAHC
jgi:hypothetical protein